MNIIEHFSEKIKGQLSTFDRIIVKGYIRQLCNVQQMQYFLSANNILFKNFGEYSENITKSLCDHIDNIAKSQNRPTKYLSSSKTSKEETALKLLKEHPIENGLICILSTVEICSTMNVQKNPIINKLELTWKNRKCKYYYLYFLDKEFGFMHLKIQTWFPFMTQIYINGREYLSKQLDKENINYTRYDNCFIDIEDINKAQNIADKIFDKNLSDMFDNITSKINDFLPKIKDIIGHEYFWCLSECEYATDIMFKSRNDLEELFPSLVEKAFYTFKCNDVMSFFGRKISGSGSNKYQGEIVSDLRKRHQGFRIKHKMKSNQVKMYDKYSVLRIETTINDPREFKVLKDVNTKEGYTVKRWSPMGKSISNMYRYAEVSKAINMRYINALPIPNNKDIPVKEIECISETKEINSRKYSGFNLLSKDTAKLFDILAKGEFLINGITNSLIRKDYFSFEKDVNSIKIRNKTTRLIAKLRVHGIIKKANRSSKYYLTQKGRKIINSLLIYKNIELPSLMA